MSRDRWLVKVYETEEMRAWMRQYVSPVVILLMEAVATTAVTPGLLPRKLPDDSSHWYSADKSWFHLP